MSDETKVRRTPVRLTLYDEDNEIVKEMERVIIPWGLLKRAIRLGNMLTREEVGDAELDAVTDFVIAVFGEDRVTRAELEQYADLGDMLAVMEAIISRGAGMFPNLTRPQKRAKR